MQTISNIQINGMFKRLCLWSKLAKKLFHKKDFVNYCRNIYITV